MAHAGQNVVAAHNSASGKALRLHLGDAVTAKFSSRILFDFAQPKPLEFCR
jgi:hypothetical protein